ncbi:hypothetical protein SNEBB_002855 [Seison nebaliae]|nr:hypothetical protein SNEBB_002855 [Seison nebaliae]
MDVIGRSEAIWGEENDWHNQQMEEKYEKYKAEGEDFSKYLLDDEDEQTYELQKQLKKRQLEAYNRQLGKFMHLDLEDKNMKERLSGYMKKLKGEKVDDSNNISQHAFNILAQQQQFQPNAQDNDVYQNMTYESLKIGQQEKLQNDEKSYAAYNMELQKRQEKAWQADRKREEKQKRRDERLMERDERINLKNVGNIDQNVQFSTETAEQKKMIIDAMNDNKKPEKKRGFLDRFRR